MKAIETATGAIPPAAAAGPAAARASAEEVTAWLLDGRFFTVDTDGAVTSWSHAAVAAFGWERVNAIGKPFVGTLLAESARPSVAASAPETAHYTGPVDALDSEEQPLSASFVIVPIELGVGYELNSLLQEILNRGNDPVSVADVRGRYSTVLSTIETSLEGKQAASTLAGALVIFDVHGRGAAARAGNVVPISEAPGLEEMRAQLEKARREAEDGRVAIRNLEDQLEEGRREVQRARGEVDAARKEAGDARDALVVANRAAEDARRAAAEARTATEAAQGRADEAQREADGLRAQLRDARDSARGMVGRADEELADAQERAARAERELSEARAEVARHEAEVAPLRERFQAAQRELGALRADLESARAAATERETVGERRAGEVERLRAELEETRAEAERLQTELSEAQARAAESAGSGVELAVVVDADVESADEPGTDLMRRALADDLLQLHCQPVLDLHTNEVVQHELLIRMAGEDGRLLLPQAFLGPARRAGLAHAIDRWVVRRAIRLLHETALAGNHVSLEVNLSPEAVHDPDLPAMVDEELAATPVDPARLVLEVTGATAADNLEETRALAKRLRGLGCRFALDDFRSNFGSFRLLRDLPLDYLKLDGELVGSLTESRTSQLIVKALVDVAAGTGMKTVAVFVSDDQTLSLLRQSGVDYAQGYKVGRPRPVEEVLETTPRLTAGDAG